MHYEFLALGLRSEGNVSFCRSTQLFLISRIRAGMARLSRSRAIVCKLSVFGSVSCVASKKYGLPVELTVRDLGESSEIDYDPFQQST